MAASSIPPGAYLRMLFIGYFDGIDSQRGLTWRRSVGKPREWASMRSIVATCAALWSTILKALVAAGRRIVENANRIEDRMLGSREHFGISQQATS